MVKKLHKPNQNKREQACSHTSLLEHFIHAHMHSGSQQAVTSNRRMWSLAPQLTRSGISPAWSQVWRRQGGRSPLRKNTAKEVVLLLTLNVCLVVHKPIERTGLTCGITVTLAALMFRWLSQSSFVRAGMFLRCIFQRSLANESMSPVQISLSFDFLFRKLDKQLILQTQKRWC